MPPVFAYGRKYGPSVTGGFVYRANPRSTFYGVYLFGDYESRRVFGLTQENRVLKTVRQIASAPQRVVSFGRDQHGELYLVGYEGMIYKIDFEGVASPGDPFPGWEFIAPLVEPREQSLAPAPM